MASSGFVVAAESGQPVPGAGGTLLAGADETERAFSLLLAHSPAGDRVPAHVHERVDESFFVLTGTYRIQCGDQMLQAGPHDFVYLPHGVPHSYEVLTGPASKLILAVPGGLEAFFDDLVGGEATAEQLLHRHGVRFLDEPGPATSG
jgi:mannose-6-phosphate isomerase-like protein (cupin superfamily)